MRWAGRKTGDYGVSAARRSPASPGQTIPAEAQNGPVVAFRDAACLSLALTAGAALLAASGIGCPVKFLTGVSCPGCGMTRAWLCLLRGNLAAAFAYHPLFWMLPVAICLATARRLRHARLGRVAALACIVLFVVLWLLRLGLPHDAAFVHSHLGDADIVGVEAPVWLLRLKSTLA